MKNLGDPKNQLLVAAMSVLSFNINQQIYKIIKFFMKCFSTILESSDFYVFVKIITLNYREIRFEVIKQNTFLTRQ